MRSWLWLVVAVAGFALMMFAYNGRSRSDPRAPWAYGFLIVGPEGPPAKDLPGQAITARIRLLLANERTEAILGAFGKKAPGGALNLEAHLRPKLIRVGMAAAALDDRALAAGRLPTPGGDEVLAGFQAPERARLTVGARTLKVVGVLKPDAALLADCYLVPDSTGADDLFSAKDPAVHPATLLRLTRDTFRDRKVLQRLEARFPASRYAKIVPRERLERGTYYAYLAGQAMLLVGGSGALIGLYRGLASRVRFAPLAAPLLEIDRRPGLAWGVHLVYFGLVFVGATLIYELPEVQTVLLAAVRDQLVSAKGPLGIAGKAYGSGNIATAAAVTFVVNFFLGSLACITLPSLVVPGLGIFLALFRAFLWGFLLAPTFVVMAGPMLPHSWTMLLEGEGYILAALFGLLVPIHLIQTGLGGTLLSRFRRVVLLNVQANLLIAIVLAVAAVYEAIEVIVMAGG